MTLSPVCSKSIAAGACSSTARCTKPGPAVCAIAKHIKGKKPASKPFWKGVETFGKYGLQSTAYDFAYTDQKYFTSRTWYEHVGMFAAGGLSGVVTQGYFVGAEGELGDYTRIGLGAGTYAAEWSVTSLIKQRSYARYNGYPQGGFYTGRSQLAKGYLLGYKWLNTSHNILLGQ